MTSKNILLIGGNSGIGKSLIQELVAENHQIYCALRRPDEISSPNVHTQKYDAEAPTSLELPEVLDGLVYCPGSINLKPFQRLNKNDFLKDLEINLFGAVDSLQQSQKALKKSSHASVVLFSTVAVNTGMSFHASIASAKGAVEGLTRSLAAEWAPKIRVNAIAPSLTNSPLAAQLLSNEQKVNAAKQRHPLKSVGYPKDTAAIASFLLSEQSKFITGQVLKVDGGISSILNLN